MKTRIEDVLEAIRAYHEQADVALIQRAYLYSAKVHAGQTRKSGEPYLTHPLAVAYLLTRLRLDDASVVTGLLHDTVEDTLATLEDIRSLFGEQVANLVDGVTKLSQIRFDTAEHKQAENFRKMLVAMAQDIRVILVKLCDRLHNMTTLQWLPESKRQRIAQETMDIYAPLANRLGINWLKTELEDLAFSHLKPSEHREIEDKVLRLAEDRREYVAQVVKELRRELDSRDVRCEVQGRPKHLYSIYKKMASHHIEFEQIYDVIAFRVLVDSVGQCYEVLGYVHAMWRPIPGRFKDYIAMPKPNRYQSLHTSVIGPLGERIEIQIRTHAMHQIAEYGIAAHWEYKEEQRVEHRSQQQFTWLRQLLEWQQDLEDPSEFLDTLKYDLFTDEVFVFTPRGEVVALKRGATPVDFAFAIHSEIGTHCAGAKVNGRMVPLRYQLKNGDMVEVITNAQQRPSKDWLSFVGTGRAKSRIRALVRGEERTRSQELGRQLLEKELKRSGLSLHKLIKDGSLEDVAEETRHRTVDGLFGALGYGRTTATQVVSKLIPEEPEKEQTEPPAAPPQQKVARRSTGGVVVQGIDDVLVRYGKCCNPLPGEPIIGFVTRGRGITVHTRTCSRAIDLDPDRRIEVDWDARGTVKRPVSVRVMTSDRPGMLATISKVFSDHGINIAQANCKVTEADRAINTFEVMIQNTEQLRTVMSNIKRLSGVLAIDRM